ncbi:MAG: hypothetical protein A2W91_06590 [Bacteroidetes bacterium GWF2_38_335]|nr:MAG: hypothetical protein A2W91_06590 [Bacteroidetes bacterium GWF2_38_335]OFY77698.1 MAG: hypothetical protein A2281_18105 [Bacteroidetes bacterium RIFOXYA12_FULL_38_20]HBS89071.1 hypothetical protein [Bacteroidales bacterium]
MITPHNKIFRMFFGFLMVVTFGCSRAQELRKECDLCKQIKQKEVETTLINYVYNDKSVHISIEAENQLLKIKETLHHGFKFIECGCLENRLIYHLWCANDETFELEVKLVEDNHFTITGIQAADFAHP